jgi:outer membrane receptor protein involved in Fe transport
MAQNATVSGYVLNDADEPLAKVLVKRLEKVGGVYTNDSGFFSISLPPNKPLALEFILKNYKIAQRNCTLAKGEVEQIQIKLEKDFDAFNSVTIKNNIAKVNEASRFAINPNLALDLPTPNSSIESIIKILVGSNNELSNQYNVRGGNFDENLIYVNDFEIYKPYLIRNGQQEGLSFINPDLVEDIDFSVGGFQAKYGDKMSSVLDVTYKKPTTLRGSVHISLLEQGIHLGNLSKNKKFTYILGARNRSNRNLLSRQETTGNYVPNSSDFQLFTTYKPNAKWELGLQTNLASSSFFLQPEAASKTATVYSPLFTANLGVDINFEGQEIDKYNTNMVGGYLKYIKNNTNTYKLQVSQFVNKEQENFDILGAYVFGDRDFDKTKPTFGLIVNPLGAGVFQNYARNSLTVDVKNISVKGYHNIGSNHYIQWGHGLDIIKINDKLYEWERQDSGRYNLPFVPNNLTLASFFNSTTVLNYTRLSGFVQDNLLFKNNKNITLQAGLRYNFTSLNKELLISPRIQATYRPAKNDRIALHINLGAYHQPPFYREMRNGVGQVNTQLKAQRSSQAIVGFDYNFIAVGRPLRFTAEAYYKNITNVVPYDIDNVRLRYFGINNAKAYATGIEFRLNGELVKDAKSWVSLGLMKTEEKIENYHFYKYKNAQGEFINSGSLNQVVSDSVRTNIGYIRRPSDRTVTFGLFFSDYLSTNKNFRVYLSTITGTNLPYSIPNKPAYRSKLIVPAYIRVDIGFSALLLQTDKAKRRNYSPFKNFENIWASLEVFNLIDKANTISYLLIKDFSNTTYPIPNRLTPRLLNLKLVAKF